jgi:hypothetical protein
MTDAIIPPVDVATKPTVSGAVDSAVAAATFRQALRRIADADSGGWGWVAADALKAHREWAAGHQQPLDQQPPANLAAALDAIRQQQTSLKAAASDIEAELRRRLDARERTTVTFDDWEVAVDAGNESIWDGDELEGVLRALVDDGVVNAAELTGIIRREPKVSRTDANRLVGRLSGPAKAAVERCRTWQPKGPGKVRVTQATPPIAAGNAATKEIER